MAKLNVFPLWLAEQITPNSYEWKWRSIPDLDSAISVLGSAIGVIEFVWKHVA